MLTTALGRQPIDTGGGYWSILHCIRDDAPPMLPCGENWSSEFRDFLAQCLNKDPTQRLGCRQLLHHPFLRDAEQHLLQLEGRKRRLLTREQGCKAGNVQGVESLLQSVMAHTEVGLAKIFLCSLFVPLLYNSPVSCLHCYSSASLVIRRGGWIL